MCDKAVDDFPFVFDSVPGWYITQELCDSCFQEPLMLKYCPVIYKTQEICNEAVNSCLLALKFVLD